MRAFVALEIPVESVIREIISLQDELKRTEADLKIVGRENLHFTVKFLGEISDWQVREVDKILKSLDLEGAAAVAIEGVGVFPGLGNPKVIWIGVAEGDRGKIVPLAERVIAELRRVGEEDNRPFEPHITIARVRSPDNKQSLASFVRRNSTHQFGSVDLTHLKFKSSVLTPRGPVYADVGDYPLR